MRWLIALCIIALLPLVSAYNNGVARLPVMGWNTWCTDDICGAIDICEESLILSIAEAMVSSGMHSLGYQYILMDDCWSAQERDPTTGAITWNVDQFPSGLPAIAEKIHNLGLKFGLYTCVGTHTCKEGRPGSYGHFEEDAKAIASWGMDFVKADFCSAPSGIPPEELYHNFSAALNATGRPIVFSLCEWGVGDVLSWGHTVGNEFRVQMDHLPVWKFPPKAAGEGFGQGTGDIIEYMGYIDPVKWSQPWGILDPDFLMTLFPYTMSFTDSRTEYTFWSLWSAPLVVATDIRGMSPEKKYILMNPEVIAINQDPGVKAGYRVMNESSGAQVWIKELEESSSSSSTSSKKAMVLYNANDISTTVVHATWAQAGWPNATAVHVRNLWERQDMGVYGEEGITATLVAHDVLYILLTRQDEAERRK